MFWWFGVLLCWWFGVLLFWWFAVLVVCCVGAKNMVVRTSDITLRHGHNFGNEVYRVVRFQN